VQRSVLSKQLDGLEGHKSFGRGEIGGRDRKAGNPEDVLPARAKRLPVGEHPAMRLDPLADNAVMAGGRLRMASRSTSHSRTLPSISVNTNVTQPVVTPAYPL
jgi:hypothetical protein